VVAACAVTIFFAGAAAGVASHIAGLTKDVKVGDKTIGQIRLHVGTHNFTATGNEGIGKATADGEQSGFYVANDMTLEQMAQMVGEHHFNWLQIVKMQPASHEGPFGPVPHADPSDDPDNPTPHDNQPWYLNEGPGGVTPNPAINPPFDLPAGTAKLLEFQDFPSGLAEGEMIAFNTYLVSIIDPTEKTYDIHAGFMWKITNEIVGTEATPRNHVVQLMMIEPTLTAEYQNIARDYRNMGWRLVPEPSAAVLLAMAILLMPDVPVRRRRNRRAA
jgi:hypothetical protein